MNTRLVLAASVVAIALSVAVKAHAEIQPVVITLTGSSTEYTVPTNKVLVLEHGYTGNDYGTNQAILLVYGTTITNTVYIDNWWRKITPIQPAVKLPFGWSIRARLEPEDEQFVMIFGLLVDPGDLYAAIESRFESAFADLSELEARLALASPRQARIRIDSTDDLLTGAWAPVDDSLSPVATNRSQWDLTALIASLERQYYRASAASRTGPGGLKRN